MDEVFFLLKVVLIACAIMIIPILIINFYDEIGPINSIRIVL